MPPVAGKARSDWPLADVEEAFRSLPERYLGADEGFDATYHIKLCDLGHLWEVRCTPHGARVRKGGTRRSPDVCLSTDADTWMRLRARGVLGHRRLPEPPARGERQPRPRHRLRGHVPPSRRPSAAAPDPRRSRRPPPHLDPDHGRGPGRPPDPWPRWDARVVPGDRSRPEPSLPRACSRPARIRVLVQAGASAPTTRAGSPRS